AAAPGRRTRLAHERPSHTDAPASSSRSAASRSALRHGCSASCAPARRRAAFVGAQTFLVIGTEPFRFSRRRSGPRPSSFDCSGDRWPWPRRRGLAGTATRRALPRAALAPRARRAARPREERGIAARSIVVARRAPEEALHLLAEVSAAEHEGRARAGEDLLERLELLHPDEHRVVAEQPGGVRLAARGRGLLLTADEVGLGLLPRLDDLVEDVLHVTGEHDVAHADRADRDAGGRRALRDPRPNLLTDAVLRHEQLVERARADRGTQRELRVAVDELAVVGHLGRGPHGIDD